MTPAIAAVHRDPGHGFTKPSVDEIVLVEGLGVEGDAHFGATVQHRSRVAQDPSQPNLRQVHLLELELLAHLTEQGHVVAPGDLGENITTEGLGLVDLPLGTVLRLGPEALVALTGLRNPCGQIEGFRQGLVRALPRSQGQTPSGRLAGVMAVVLAGGVVRAGDPVSLALPPEPHRPLMRI